MTDAETILAVIFGYPACLAGLLFVTKMFVRVR